MIREADSQTGTGPCLADYVDGLFAPRCQSERLNDSAVKEVATALEAYARIEGGAIIGTDNLAFLASSAVHALGREDLAIEAVIMGTGAVYPQKLEAVEHDTVWVINTERLFPDLAACTELAFFSVVYHLVGKMLHLWDDTQGSGTLGLKRLRAVSRVFAGGKAGERERTAWTERIIRTVEHRLEDCSMDRGWSDVPRVMMLD